MRCHQWKITTDKVCCKEKRIMKTQHCDQCKHATMRALPKPTLICAMLHKPRFYAPVYWLKDSWGWKRKCEDFLEQPVPEPEGQAITFAKEELAAPVQEFVCSTGLCHYKPAAGARGMDGCIG